jgi:predicted alpha/beta superfamily hydrolase
MRLSFTLITVSVLLFALSCTVPSNRHSSSSDGLTRRMYSKAVDDTFSIMLSLPEGYDDKQQDKYPVAYLLDANIYFGIMAATAHRYAEIGIIPPIILVGIGQKDLIVMDSLRNRDFTFPTASPKYEMPISGGADKFLKFITSELMPDVEQNYHCDTANRVLMGHSLGGYFVCYALAQNLAGYDRKFSHYIAASPSLHYNDYYLMQQLAGVPTIGLRADSIDLYLTYGGLEDEEDSDDTTMKSTEKTMAELSTVLQGKAVRYKADGYSNLAHMDMPLPTFLKGLQAQLATGEEE